MKIKITLLFLFLSSGFMFSQNINIPDPVFKNRLIEEGVDTNNDGEIQESEALSITELNVNASQSSTKIESLIGIEYFTNLIILNCGSNLLSTLGVSNLTNLEILKAYNNQLTSINVNGLTQLLQLWVGDNLLETIDVSSLHNLWWLYCTDNLIQTLDISSNVNLSALWAGDNQISSLDLLPLTLLEEILLYNNTLSSLSVNHLNLLISLDCSNNLLTEIDVSNMPELKLLYLSDNLLSELDCSTNGTVLIQCGYNPDLTSINVQNGVISSSDPDMLWYGFIFSELPNLTSICMDQGEEQALSHSGYIPDNVTVFTGPDCTLGINEFSLEETFIYPNPVKNGFTINSNVEINNYILYDTTGKKIIFSNNFNMINQKVTSLNSGIYFLKLESIFGTQKIIKLVKE